ncbi:hypothetical protein T492DRAFT_1003874, partial [Pavlovales sp. CCMP2436]
MAFILAAAVALSGCRAVALSGFGAVGLFAFRCPLNAARCPLSTARGLARSCDERSKIGADSPAWPSARAARRPPCVRMVGDDIQASVPSELPQPGPSSWLDQLRVLFDGPQPEVTPELQSLVDFLTCPSGFSLRMTLGSAPARSAGGSGSLARGSSATVQLELPVKLSIDGSSATGFDPFQGDVLITKVSKYFATPPSFWVAEYERPDDPVPTLWQLRVSCSAIDASGDNLVPEGPIFFSCNIGRGRPREGRPGQWELTGGKITVKEDVAGTRGILAEYKVVGVFNVLAGVFDGGGGD